MMGIPPKLMQAVIWIFFVEIISVALHEYGHYLVFNSRGLIKGYGIYVSCPAVDISGYDVVGILSGFVFGCLAYPLMMLNPIAFRLIPQWYFYMISFVASAFDLRLFIHCSILRRPFPDEPTKHGLFAWWLYIPLKRKGA